MTLRLFIVHAALARWRPPAGITLYEVSIVPADQALYAKLVCCCSVLILPIDLRSPIRATLGLLDAASAAVVAEHGAATAVGDGLRKAGEDFEAAVGRMKGK